MSRTYMYCVSCKRTSSVFPPQFRCFDHKNPMPFQFDVLHITSFLDSHVFCVMCLPNGIYIYKKNMRVSCSENLPIPLSRWCNVLHCTYYLDSRYFFCRCFACMYVRIRIMYLVVKLFQCLYTSMYSTSQFFWIFFTFSTGLMGRHTYKNVHIYAYLYICIFVCMYVYLYIYVCIYIYAYIHKYNHTYTHSHTHKHTLFLACSCIHLHIQNTWKSQSMSNQLVNESHVSMSHTNS